MYITITLVEIERIELENWNVSSVRKIGIYRCSDLKKFVFATFSNNKSKIIDWLSRLEASAD